MCCNTWEQLKIIEMSCKFSLFPLRFIFHKKYYWKILCQPSWFLLWELVQDWCTRYQNRMKQKWKLLVVLHNWSWACKWAGIAEKLRKRHCLCFDVGGDWALHSLPLQQLHYELIKRHYHEYAHEVFSLIIHKAINQAAAHSTQEIEVRLILPCFLNYDWRHKVEGWGKRR